MGYRLLPWRSSNKVPCSSSVLVSKKLSWLYCGDSWRGALTPSLPPSEGASAFSDGGTHEKKKICVNIIDVASSDLKIMISKLLPDEANSLPSPAMLTSAQRGAVEVFYFVNEEH